MSTVSWELRFSRQHTVVSAIFPFQAQQNLCLKPQIWWTFQTFWLIAQKLTFKQHQQSYNSIVAYTFMESKLLKISWFYFAKYLLGSIFFTTKFNPQIFSPSNFSTLKISEVLKANAAWNSIAIWGKNGWILIFFLVKLWMQVDKSVWKLWSQSIWRHRNSTAYKSKLRLCIEMHGTVTTIPTPSSAHRQYELTVWKQVVLMCWQDITWN